MLLLWTIAILITGYLAYLVGYLKTLRNYWIQRFIPHDKPHYLYGSLNTVVKRNQHFNEALNELYTKYKLSGPFAGMHLYLRPTCLLTDLDLIKAVVIRDFNNFEERGLFNNAKDDPLTAQLFTLDGDKWKTLRTIMSQSISGNNLNAMQAAVLKVSENLTQVLNEKLKHHAQFTATFDMTDLCQRYATDAIANCTFGLECSSIKNPDTALYQYSKRISSDQRHNNITNAFIQSFPKLARCLRMRTISDDITQFFMHLMQEAVELREREHTKRNDLINLLIELKQNGAMTIEEMAAQVYGFFLAGIETSAATIAFALYELALKPELQEKLRKEITEQHAIHNELTYEHIKEMEYLEMVIKETLRKYPVVSTITRKSLKHYRTLNLNFIIPKDCQVLIPVAAIHHDPEYYPKPEVFDPERFTHAEIQKRHAAAWLPFGEGPRNCIGWRFAEMLTSIGLAKLVHEFRFKKCAKTAVPLKFKKDNQMLIPEDGIHLQVEPSWWSE